MANTDYLGAQQLQQGALNTAYQGQVAQTNSTNQGIASLGQAAIMMAMLSDRRAKEDIKRVGETDDGQPIYAFRYKGQPAMQIGLMAQDVEKRRPSAVATDPETGLKMVNYADALF